MSSKFEYLHRAIWFLVLSFFIFATGDSEAKQPAQVLQNITEAQAVAIAEKYVHDNGYTDFTPDPDKLAPESLDFGLSKSDELSLRHDTLKPKAYGICPLNPGWLVVFQYSDRKLQDSRSPYNLPELGRTVRMDEFGRNIILEHKSLRLKFVDKRL